MANVLFGASDQVGLLIVLPLMHLPPDAAHGLRGARPPLCRRAPGPCGARDRGRPGQPNLNHAIRPITAHRPTTTSRGRSRIGSAAIASRPSCKADRRREFLRTHTHSARLQPDEITLENVICHFQPRKATVFPRGERHGRPICRSDQCAGSAAGDAEAAGLAATGGAGAAYRTTVSPRATRLLRMAATTCSSVGAGMDMQDPAERENLEMVVVRGISLGGLRAGITENCRDRSSPGRRPGACRGWPRCASSRAGSARPWGSRKPANAGPPFRRGRPDPARSARSFFTPGGPALQVTGGARLWPSRVYFTGRAAPSARPATCTCRVSGACKAGSSKLTGAAAANTGASRIAAAPRARWRMNARCRDARSANSFVPLTGAAAAGRATPPPPPRSRWRTGRRP